jgi:hypothetical protein
MAKEILRIAGFASKGDRFQFVRHNRESEGRISPIRPYQVGLNGVAKPEPRWANPLVLPVLSRMCRLWVVDWPRPADRNIQSARSSP